MRADAKVTDDTSDGADMGWAIPVMQAGYAGRGLVYVVVGVLSLVSIWRGGGAQGTSSAFGWLQDTTLGFVVLGVIFAGMLAYALWRGVDAIWDLEDYGTESKGIVARIGMVVTGAVHLGLGFLALTLLWGEGSSGGGIPRYVGMVMELPGGRWIVGAGALATMGAGGYYLWQGISQSYREHLRADAFTRKVNPILRAGVMAQGVVIAVIGLLLMYAALQADPSEAGGVGKAFEWVSGQVYGQLLVTALCISLLGYALFCFVNAAFRIVPKAQGPDIQSLAARATS